MSSSLDAGRLSSLLLIVLAVLMIFTGIGLRNPWPPDEPRFAQSAIEMVQSGNWLIPTRGGELYPDKPPVFIWAIAIFYALTGSIKLAFLLPSALGSLLMLFLVYDLGRRLWDRNAALLATAALLLTLQFTLQARTAQMDALVSTWITLGCYGLLRQLLLRDGWRWYYLGGAAMGLGVITKGVGFLPLLLLLPYVASRRIWPQEDEIRGSWHWWAGPACMIGVIAVWLVPVLLLAAYSGDPAYAAYRDNILFHQTVNRYANSWGHLRPFWYYLVVVIPALWLPLNLLLPWLLPDWWRALRSGDRRIFLPLAWVLLVLLFFSFSPGKRGVYILPALPMLALASGPYLRDVLARRWPGRLVWGAVAAVSLLLLTAGLLGLAGVEKLARLAEHAPSRPWWFVLGCGLAGLVIVLATWRHKVRSWLLFAPVLWVLYGTWGFLMLDPVRTPQSVIAAMRPYMPKRGELAMIGLREQFLLFSPYPFTHFGYHTPVDQQQAAAWQWLQNHPDGRIVTARRDGLACFDLDRGRDVGFAHGDDWVLLGHDAMTGDCPAPESPVREYRFVREEPG